jgi:hypothetical protein
MGTVNAYNYGYLASSSHGYYFVYLQFDEEQRADRWFTQYEPGADAFAEDSILTDGVHGFHTFGEAKAYCEKDARDLDAML